MKRGPWAASCIQCSVPSTWRSALPLTKAHTEVKVDYLGNMTDRVLRTRPCESMSMQRLLASTGISLSRSTSRVCRRTDRSPAGWPASWRMLPIGLRMPEYKFDFAADPREGGISSYSSDPRPPRTAIRSAKKETKATANRSAKRSRAGG